MSDGEIWLLLAFGIGLVLIIVVAGIQASWMVEMRGWRAEQKSEPPKGVWSVSGDSKGYDAVIGNKRSLDRFKVHYELNVPPEQMAKRASAQDSTLPKRKKRK